MINLIPTMFWREKRSVEKVEDDYYINIYVIRDGLWFLKNKEWLKVPSFLRNNLFLLYSLNYNL